MDPRVAGLVGGLAAVAMALAARGMAGDEEPGHYLIARYSLEQPRLLLSLAGRPFVNLVLALPSQGGLLAARLAGAFATGLTAYAVARIARRANLGHPLLVVGFLLVQPFFLAHAGTAMTEPWAAGLLAGMLLAYTERRGRLLAVLAAVAPLARLELLIFWPAVLWVLWRERPRRWALALPIPLLLLNAFGALATGDGLWLLHQSRWEAYPARESLHYVRSFVWIVGLGLFPAVLTGLIHGGFSLRRPKAAPTSPPLSRGAAKVEEARTRALWATIVSALGILFVYSALAAWHPVTYGNLRYFANAGPSFALLATVGLGLLVGSSRRPGDWVGPGLAVVGAGLWWNHPLLRDFGIMARWDVWPLVAAFAWLACFAVPRVAKKPVNPLWIGALFVAVNVVDIGVRHRSTLHLVPPPEHAAVEAAARALPRPLPRGARLIAAHPLLALHRGLNPYDPSQWPPLTDRVSMASPPGTIFFWDTHYVSGKRQSLELLALLETKAWRFGRGFIAADSGWAGAFFVRSGPGEGPVLAALRDGSDGRAWLDGARVVQYGIPPGRKNVEMDPKNDEYWRLLAQRLFSAGDTTAAWGALAHAREVDPQDARNAAYRAEFHRHLKQIDQAAAAAQEALAARPQDPTFRYLLGRILLDQRRTEEAATHLSEAARGLPKRWESQYDAGAVLYDLGRLDEATGFLETASRLRPNDWRSVQLLAQIDWRGQRPEAALARVRAFSARRPEMAEPYLLLGDLLVSMKRPDEARAVWKDGLKQTGGDPEIASRLEPAAPPAEP